LYKRACIWIEQLYCRKSQESLYGMSLSGVWQYVKERQRVAKNFERRVIVMPCKVCGQCVICHKAPFSCTSSLLIISFFLDIFWSSCCGKNGMKFGVSTILKLLIRCCEWIALGEQKPTCKDLPRYFWVCVCVCVCLCVWEREGKCVCIMCKSYPDFYVTLR